MENGTILLLREEGEIDQFILTQALRAYPKARLELWFLGATILIGTSFFGLLGVQGAPGLADMIVPS